MTNKVAVRLGDGTIVSLADLPAENLISWSSMDMSRLVRVYLAGLLSMDDVSKKYGLASDEFQSWLDRYIVGGVRALVPLETARRAS